MTRTNSQHFTSEVQQVTAPFQYSLATKSGCDIFAHTLQGLMEWDRRTTVTSIDGIRACRFQKASGNDGWGRLGHAAIQKAAPHSVQKI